MKSIRLRSFETIRSAEIIRMVAAQAAPNSGGINYEQMRARVRILDALDRDAGSATLLLEDADHEALKAVIRAFPFAIAHKDLLTVIDDVLNAEAPAT